MNLRLYLTWPTVALHVGPDRSRAARVGAWIVSVVLGLSLGVAWFGDVFRGWFTLGQNDNLFGWFIAFAAVFFLPMVVLAATLPLVGGILLVTTSALSILAVFPASHFDAVGSAVYTLKLGGPSLLVGLGFLWSAERVKPPLESGTESERNRAHT